MPSLFQYAKAEDQGISFGGLELGGGLLDPQLTSWRGGEGGPGTECAKNFCGFQ